MISKKVVETGGGGEGWKKKLHCDGKEEITVDAKELAHGTQNHFEKEGI